MMALQYNNLFLTILAIVISFTKLIPIGLVAGYYIKTRFFFDGLI
jgi:hypothetical protein